MKTFLILFLAMALAAVAFLTRPSKREFVIHLADQASGPGKAWTGKAIDQAEKSSDFVVIRDRFLWTDIEKDGKVIYTGLFGKFIPRGESSDRPAAKLDDMARLFSQAVASR